MKIQIKHRFSGNPLFKLEKDNNTIKITLEVGVSTNADLGNANLRGADLRGANLRGAYLGNADLGNADLGNADLRGADLGNADLGNADLRGANLGNADLGNADLRGADLRGANLRGAYLEKVKTPPIHNHQFTSEILWRAATTETQKDFSARVRLETNQCWSFFYALAKKKKVVAWIKKVLGKWDAYNQKIIELENRK